MLSRSASPVHRAALLALVAVLFSAVCDSAARGAVFEVTAPGAWPGDTCAGVNDCALRPSHDHEYLVHIPTSGNWTFSICHSNWDSWIALGETPCTIGGGGSWFNDDAPGCGGGSRLTVNDLPAGDYYLTIEGFSQSACGTYTLLIYDEEPCAAPTCPSGSIAAQPPTTPDGPWETWYSEYSPLNESVYFESYAVPGDIHAVRWWGILIGMSNSSCYEEPIQFVLQFFAADGKGLPNYQNPDIMYTVDVTPEYGTCVYDDYGIMAFTAELDPPCALQHGWISISGNGGDCYFYWMSSEDGDGQSLWVLEQFGQPVWTTHDHDRSVCLVQVCVGDVNGDGEVNVIDLLAVLAAWGPCGGACPEDLNADGQVNVLDLLALLGAWGPCA